MPYCRKRRVVAVGGGEGEGGDDADGDEEEADEGGDEEGGDGEGPDRDAGLHFEPSDDGDTRETGPRHSAV